MPDASQSGSNPTAVPGDATTAAGPTASSSTTIAPSVITWFEKQRGIHQGALTHGGVHSVVRDGSNVIVFPYRRNGSVVNRKYRTADKRFWLDAGGELILWNLDCLQANPDHVYIVEGEIDALAFIEAGIWNVLSVPNGAPAAAGDAVPDPEQDDAFRYLWNCKNELAGRRFVIAVDADEAGMRLRQALVARLGRANCEIIEWPEGIKDGDEYLIEVGPTEFRAYVQASRKPYPIRGLWGWNDVMPTPPMETFHVGIGGLRDMVRLARGTISVVTGIPNHGKSAVVKHIACEMIRNHGWNVTQASFEDRIYSNLMPELITIMSGRPLINDRHALQQRGDAQATLARRMSFIGDEGFVEEAMTLEWLVDIVRDAKVRHGTDMLIIDPWNEVEHIWGREKTETLYIAQALKDLRRLAVETEMHIMVVAHPTKLQHPTDVPGLYSISGSANWANKVDIGLAVHQPEFAAGPGGPTQVHVLKIKRRELGHRGMVTLQFDRDSRRFELNGDRWAA